MKLIKIAHDHYIIVDDSEIREGDWYIDDTKSIRQSITSDQSYWSKRKEYKKITHSTQPLEYSSKIGKYWGKVMPLTLTIPEIKELIGEVDVEKKGENYSTTHEDVSDKLGKYLVNVCFQDGYYTALEDNKEKKYTEEDMKVAITQAFLSGVERLEDFERVQEMILDNIKPKTEWEVEFVDGKLTLKK